MMLVIMKLNDTIEKETDVETVLAAKGPDLYGGFGTSLSFKGIDVSVNFTYSIGGKSYDS